MEKCLKIFETAGLVTYADAQNFCKAQDDSHLLSISSQEKQKFLENFFKSNSVVDNVWIGLKFVQGLYLWTDGTEYEYINWESGNPKYNESYCVQILTESTKFGLWSEESCLKKNLVICEKIQSWTMVQMQTALMELQDTVANRIIPVGFIYVQLPKESPPAETWPWMEWQDISSDYAGLFFRTEGGDAASFGKIQESDSPRLITILSDDGSSGSDSSRTVDVTAGVVSPALQLDGYRNGDITHLHVVVSSGETRPRYMAIKIWKREKNQVSSNKVK